MLNSFDTEEDPSRTRDVLLQQDSLDSDLQTRAMQ